MKKFNVVFSKKFTDKYPKFTEGQGAQVIEKNDDLALSLAQVLFGSENVEGVEALSLRKSDFIDKDELKVYIEGGSTSVTKSIVQLLTEKFEL